MSINLLDVAKGALGSGAFSSLAGSLGESEQKTKSAFDLAGSAILGGLIKKMSNPQGAKEVYDEVNQVDSGLLGSAIDALTGRGSEENTSTTSSLGWKLISRLLGSNSNSLIEMIAKTAGIGQGSTKSLLSMLAPLLLGTIAKQVTSGGLDLKGLTNLVLGQKSHVAKTLPANFSQQLGIANLLSEGTQSAKRAAAETAQAGSGLLKTLVPLAILVAIGLLVWKMTSSNAAKQAAKTTVDAAESAVAATGDAIENVAEDVSDAADRITMNKPVVPGVNFEAISEELGMSFGKLSESISTISDEASARSVLPQIEEVSKQIGLLGFDKMPQEATATLQGILRPLVEKLQAAIELASKIPGVKSILEPAVGSLMDSVSAYVKAS